MPQLPRFRSVQDVVRIRGFSQRVKDRATEMDVRRVVSALAFDQLDPKGREITDIGHFQRRDRAIRVRLDRQPNTTAGAVNLQVQVNDVALAGLRLTQAEGTTIAQVLVPSAVHRAAFTCHEFNVRAHLENIVRSALLASYTSPGCQFMIEEIPA